MPGTLTAVEGHADADSSTSAARRSPTASSAPAAAPRWCSCTTSPRCWTTGTRGSSTGSPPTATSSPSTTAASAPRAARSRTRSPRWPPTRPRSSARSATSTSTCIGFSLGGRRRPGGHAAQPRPGPPADPDRHRASRRRRTDQDAADRRRRLREGGADTLGPAALPVLQPQPHRQAGRNRLHRPAAGTHERPRQADLPPGAHRAAAWRSARPASASRTT